MNEITKTYSFDGYTVNLLAIRRHKTQVSTGKNTKVVGGIMTTVLEGTKKDQWEDKHIYAFSELQYNGHTVINNIFIYNTLIEILRAYASKKMNVDKEYVYASFQAKIVFQDAEPSLQIIFFEEKEEEDKTILGTVYYDKAECNVVASNLSKALQFSHLP